MDVIEEVEMMEDEEREENEPKTRNQKANGGIQGFKPPQLESLEHVKINVTPETPVSTLKGILNSEIQDFSFTKKELRKTEGQMKQAFNEFYQKLRLLKSYWYC